MSKIEIVLEKWNSADSVDEFRADEIVEMLDTMTEYIEHQPDTENQLAEITRIAIESKMIIEQFQKLLGVYTPTEALAKTAVLMREEEDLQNDILSTILEFCEKHYWDSFENDKSIIMEHIKSVIEFVKAEIKKRRG